jgi:virginiamycin B lyase
MKSSRWQPRLAALLCALVVSAGLLGLSSAPVWAAAGTVTEFPLPQHGTPFDITAGPDGNLWFTAGTGEVGRITSGGSIIEFALPTGASFPEGITAGPDGNLWFTESRGNKIGRITPAGLITEFPLLSRCGKYLTCAPHGITTGPNGNLWFTMENGNAIGSISPSGSFAGGFSIPTASSVAEGITTGPDGNLWFTEERASKIGRFSTS